MPKLRQSIIAMISRNYPFLSGCAQIANSSSFKKITGTAPSEAWSRTQGGEVFCSLNDFVGRSVFYFGCLDPKLIAISRILLRKGDVVLDVGANIGVFSVAFAELVGSTGKVYAFEPNPVLADRLGEAIARNGLSSISLHSVALGSIEREGMLNVPRGNAGEGSLIWHPKAANGNQYVVNVICLDTFYSSSLQRIRLIKIDVEGFELEVLQGAKRLLSTHPPDAILFEVNSIDKNSTATQPIFELLESYGYYFLCVPKSLLRLKLTPFEPRKDTLLGHDLLAIHRDAEGIPTVILRGKPVSRAQTPAASSSGS